MNVVGVSVVTPGPHPPRVPLGKARARESVALTVRFAVAAALRAVAFGLFVFLSKLGQPFQWFIYKDPAP